MRKTPTHFWIDRKGALDAAQEIVGVNLHLTGDKLKSYLDMNFPSTWDQFDVLKTGWVEVE